ncbi:MAG: replicative DNA helicase [Rickettsiales bacterium]|jgi:replicative DNA helicase|nr:replicative DNA helicase [Rickettsiales bacterium]
MQDEDKEYKNLYNIEAEQIILGKIISNNEYFIRVADYLKEEFFYELAHREIYKYISNTVQKSTIVADSITLKNFFDGNEILYSIGGSNYLSILLSISTGIFDVLSYAKLIQDLAIKRNLAIIGEEIVNKVYQQGATPPTTAQEQIENAETKLFELSSKNEHGKGFAKINASLIDTIENIRIAKQRDDHISGIGCRLTDIDKMLGGFQKSDLIILAGRPSMGKTTLAINIAYNVALNFKEEYDKTGKKKSVGFFSLEMPANQITAKILSIETGISTEKFRKGEIDEEELLRITEKAENIANMPIFIDDTPALTINTVKTRARRLIKQENLSFLMIDYLQLLHGTKESSMNNRVLEISEITQGLKAIAKEFQIPIIALSQLSRLVEQRPDKRPMLSDLRESGSIEQDADVVMFIYRDSYYEERKKPSEDDVEKMQAWVRKMARIRNRSELLIEKHRNGPIGEVWLYYNAEISKFTDYAGRYDVQEVSQQVN